MIQNRYNDHLFDDIYLQMPWVTDISIFSRPFLLLFMSKQVRIVFGKAIFCGHHTAFLDTTTITPGNQKGTRTFVNRVTITNAMVSVG